MKSAGAEIAVETARAVYTVSDLTRNIRFLLEEHFSGVWVEGEVSGHKHHTSGHKYFTLKDADAQLSCVMFRRENHGVDFDLSDGLQVLCYGRISVYPVRGQYQLYVERIEPKGAGALQLRFKQLTEKLRAEGLFDDAVKKELPYLPSRIGIVTSRDGAALRDILHVLDRRFPDVHVLIYPVQVQGNAAAGEIAAAIDDFNRWNNADVLIVGRGGGSLEDLWAFNEEIVARAIYRSDIPVISAVGHEVDFTIADFVADMHAATPSAAAEMVLPEKADLVARVTELRLRHRQCMAAKLKNLRQDLRALETSRGFRDPLYFFGVQRQRLDELKRATASCVTNFLRCKKDGVAALAARLESLGPLATLRRGFSATLKIPNGRLVTSIADVKPGDRVKTKLKNGFFISQVKEIHR